MARLSQQALGEAMQAFTLAGVTDVRDMDALHESLQLVRGRVRDTPASDDLTAQKHGMARAIQPLVVWLSSESDLTALGFQARSDLVWNLYTAAMSRTAGADAFPLVTASEDIWNEVMLQALGPPGLTPEPVQTPCKIGVRTLYPWVLVVGGGILLMLDAWVLSGRWRFYMLLSGVLSIMLGLASLYWSCKSGNDDVFQTVKMLEPRVRQNVSFTTGLTGNDGSASVNFPLTGPPPAFAPVIPGNEQVLAPSSSMQAAQHGSELSVASPLQFSIGDAVLLTGVAESAPLCGQAGTIVQILTNRVEVQLESGLKVGPIGVECVVKKPLESGTIAGTPAHAPVKLDQTYAPFTIGENDAKVQLQAGRLKTALEKSSGLQSTVPTWGQLFWQAVKNESDLYGLEKSIQNVLAGHGYIGASTVGPPRVEELKKQLIQLEALGGPTHGSGGSILRVSGLDGAADPESMAWHLKLPADLQRAGPEIYRNIRSEGVSSVRQWVNEQHPTLEQKSSPQYQDLFTTATIIDFEVADCRTEGMLMQKLATSDALEIHLRRLGAFIYLRRTRDKAGANRILGVKAPGTNTDIAPKWLLDDANLHSKTEYQRQERGAKASRYDGGGGEFRQRRGGGKSSGGGGGAKGGGRSKKGGQATQG